MPLTIRTNTIRSDVGLQRVTQVADAFHVGNVLERIAVEHDEIGLFGVTVPRASMPDAPAGGRSCLAKRRE
jgi:hypothetical protein